MLIVNRASFTLALNRAKKLAHPNATLSSLRCVQLTLNHESITLRSTNLDLALVEILPATGPRDSNNTVVCVQPAHIISMLNSLPPDEDVTLQASQDELRINTKTIKADCSTTDFPEVPRAPRDIHALIELPTDFMKHVRYVRAAVSRDNVRFALTGILLDFAQGVMLGCDGTRLHCARVLTPANLPRTIVPARTFELDTPSHVVIPKITKGERLDKVFFYIENGYVVARTLDANYPDYRAVLRKEHTLTARLKREALLAAIEESVPVLDEKHPSCWLHLNEHFELRVQNANKTAYVNNVPASVDGGELTIALNPLQVLAALRYMIADEIVLAFKDWHDAVYVVGEDGKHWALVLPLRLPQPQEQ